MQPVRGAIRSLRHRSEGATLKAFLRKSLEDELQHAEGPEQYHAIHAQYHPIFRQKLYDRAYYDIFFFDLNGDLIYSVFKDRVEVKSQRLERRRTMPRTFRLMATDLGRTQGWVRPSVEP